MEKPLRSPADLWCAEKLHIPLEDLSQDKVEAFQLEKIREMLLYLKQRSRFYSRVLKDISPEDIRTMDDFRTLPATEEADLSGHEEDFLCVRPHDVERIVTVPTTGTTGRKKRISFTIEDLKDALEFIAVGFSTFVRPGDRMLVFMSGDTAGGIGDSVRRALEPFNIETRVCGNVTDIGAAYEALRSFGPQNIVGMPCHMAALARYSELHGRPEVRSVLLSADDVPLSVCKRLRSIWGCDTFPHFGMTELCIAGGVECSGHDGLHCRSCHHLYEILDPDENGFGQLAVTTFNHRAMPLLRYKTGDIASLKTGRCACGSPLIRLGRIKGRSKNSAVLGGRRFFLSGIAEAVYQDPAAVDFDCAVFPDAGKLGITVRTLAGDPADLSGCRERIREEVFRGPVDIIMDQAEISSFEDIYDPKKTLHIIKGPAYE